MTARYPNLLSAVPAWLQARRIAQTRRGPRFRHSLSVVRQARGATLGKGDESCYFFAFAAVADFEALAQRFESIRERKK
jgi:hypothetical protein